jgi:uncharacterized membrane protein YeaQ/YmgE (transglycosylase-associated protein family)
MLTYILLLLISGLIVGALARLAIPGPNPMSIGMTIVIGIVGSFVGGLLGKVLFGRPGGIILAVLVSAAIVYFMQRSRHGATSRI